MLAYYLLSATRFANDRVAEDWLKDLRRGKWRQGLTRLQASKQASVLKRIIESPWR